MGRTIIGVMGPGNASEEVYNAARELGKLIAENDWVLLTGGRNTGVMDAASEGASTAGGLVLGILPGSSKKNASRYVDISVCTGMGSARNNINILSSDVIIACGSGAGTTSEIMLALKSQKPLILLQPSDTLVSFISELPYSQPKLSDTPEEALAAIQHFL